ncbi:hypothetical protein, partial [Duganella radicis]|uniref:hypothetical protein n=1 Tax=Duganella radicis TaxID=551988 RepID=UPI0014795CDE
LAGWDGGTPSGPFGERGTLDAMDAMGLADEGAAGGGRAAPNAARQAAAADAGLDCAELAQLLPAGGNDGIFDVVLPNGERMGVVVNGQATALSYLLSPASEQLAGRLRRQRMELEGRMERLTQRNVNITVL